MKNTINNFEVNGQTIQMNGVDILKNKNTNLTPSSQSTYNFIDEHISKIYNQFLINPSSLFSDELKYLPDDAFITSDVEYTTIDGYMSMRTGQIVHDANFGQIIILKPSDNTKMFYIKGILSGRNCTTIGYADTDNAEYVTPIYQIGENNSTKLDNFIKPIKYLYLYVGLSNINDILTIKSIDDYIQYQQIDLNDEIVDKLYINQPHILIQLPYTLKKGYIDNFGMVHNDNSFNNSLAYFDLDGIDYINIKMKTAVNTDYCSATFDSDIENHSNYLPPLILDKIDKVIDITVKVQARYLFVYLGNNGKNEQYLNVSNALLDESGTVSQNMFYDNLSTKVDIIKGDNLFNKDSSFNLYDTLLSSANNTSQPSYAKSFMVTHYIPIEEGKSYIGNYSSGDNAINLCVLDYTKTNVLLYIHKESESNKYAFTAPAGAKYVRMTIPMNIKDSFIFNEGTEIIPNAYYEDKPVYQSDINVDEINNNILPWKDKTIAMYGDSITELCGNTSVTETSWAGYLIKALQCNGIIRGWGGTALKHSIWDNSTAGTNKHWFNEFGEKVAVGTEGAIQCNPVGMCDWKRIITQFPETIKDTIDAVILMGGTNDFRSVEIGDVEYTLRESVPETPSGIDVDWIESEYYTGGDFDVTKIQGAVCSAILKLQTWMPQAVIIVATQLSGYWLTQGENGTHQLVSDKSGLTEGQFALKIAEAARYMSVPVIDINGLTGINQWNRTKYITDSVHPYSTAGKKAMARVFIGEMKRIMPNF